SRGGRDAFRGGQLRLERRQAIAVLLFERVELASQLIDILAQRLRAVLLHGTGSAQPLAARWRRRDQTEAQHRRHDRRKEASPPRRHKTSSWNGKSHSKRAR